MVVGLGKYQNQQEAFPLDKKTLNKVALRSFLSGASFNDESFNSIGWLWALEPALRKIHTDEDDLHLAMGHHLEASSATTMLSPLAMGVVLALEQEKSDLETIRSARTMASYTADAFGRMLMYYVFIPLLAMVLVTAANTGSTIAAVGYFAILFILQIALRYFSIQYGYKHGMQAIEKMQKNKTALKKAMMTAGAFMLGGILVAISTGFSIQLSLAQDGSNLATIGNLLPGIGTVAMGILLYHLVANKNYSMGKCFIVVLLISFILALLQEMI